MAKTIPARKDVKKEFKWDLTSIYKSDTEWEQALESLAKLNQAVAACKGTLGSGPHRPQHSPRRCAMHSRRRQ